MTTDLIYIYRSFLESQGIQFLLLNESFDNLNQMDFGFRQSVFSDFDYTIISNFFKRIFREDSVIMVKDKMQLDYCIFEFPDNFKKDYQADYGMIGPVVFEPSTPAELRKKMKINNISENFYQTFVEFHNRVPHISSIDIWHALLRPLLKEVFGDGISYRITSYNESIKKQYNENNMPDSVSLQNIEDRYYIEQQMMDAVSKGNKEKALDWHRKFQNFRFQPRAADEMRHQKNMLLILNTLLRKAIQQAGIHPYYIDQISHNQALAIEFASTLKELEEMPTSMIRKYCLVVHNHNFKAYSAPVERCLQYIEFFYAQPLTLDELAQHCYVTSNYLSSLFKKEIGITLKEYINQTRIQKSILLLNTTHHSIQEIAGRCGFPDANYFSRIFKKLNGVTPLSYRKNINR